MQSYVIPKTMQSYIMIMKYEIMNFNIMDLMKFRTDLQDPVMYSWSATQ